MEKHLELLEAAKKTFKTADHLAYMVYPLVNDIKLIVAITENIYLTLANALEAVVAYDLLYKRIPLVANDFDAKFKVFKEKCAPRYGIEKESIDLIEELRNIIKSHENSRMEFVRQDKLIICSPTFKMKTLNIDTVKDYLTKTRKFLKKVEGILKWAF